MVARHSTMPGRKEKAAPVPAPDINPSSLHLLKRAQLQQYCKRLGLGASGKNADLLLKLQSHLKPNGAPAQGFEDNLVCGECLARNQEKESLLQKESSDQERQCWCVTHGHLLTTSKWAHLSLCHGRAGLYNDTFVPLHLTPSSLSVPQGFDDNLICGECLDRNQEKESRLKESSNPDEGCSMGNSKSSMSAFQSRNKSGRFQPREDPVYARKVDELLGQLAMGKVDSQKVLQPIRPAVVHSPMAKQESSPIAIAQRQATKSK